MAEQSYGESLFDLGVGVPGAGEGIIDLIFQKVSSHFVKK